MLHMKNVLALIDTLVTDFHELVLAHGYFGQTVSNIFDAMHIHLQEQHSSILKQILD